MNENIKPFFGGLGLASRVLYLAISTQAAIGIAVLLAHHALG